MNGPSSNVVDQQEILTQRAFQGSAAAPSSRFVEVLANGTAKAVPFPSCNAAMNGRPSTVAPIKSKSSDKGVPSACYA